MVLNNEIKEDIFAPFQLEVEVRNNETKLREKEARVAANNGSVDGNHENNNNGRNDPKEDVFAEFEISEILKKQQEQQQPRSKRNVKEEKDGQDNDGVNINMNPLRHVSDLVKIRVQRFYGRRTTHQSGTEGEWDDGSIPVRGAATANIPGDEKAEQQQQNKQETESETKNSAASKAPAEVAAAAPAPPVVLTDILGSQFYWESPANDIFADFDLSAIVRDYEKLRRKTDYAPKTSALADDNDDSDDEYPRKWRYRTVKTLWLDNFPRCHGLIFRVVLPLLIVLSIALGLGYWLAQFEFEEEYHRNDEATRNRFILEQFPYDDALQFVLGIPTVCFNHYMSVKSGTKNNQTTATAAESPILNIQESLTEWIGGEFPSVRPGFNNSLNESLAEIKSYMVACEEKAAKLLTNIIDVTSSLEDVTNLDKGLTFNWIRCWNTTLYGNVNPFRANRAQRNAAFNQSDFYEDVWNENRVQLFDRYLEEANCTTFSCRQQAFDRSAEYATGSSMCGLNNGASAWFWFVVMTTVGYGNQSPQTKEGLALVACLAWLSIVVWAMILYVAGSVIGIIVDDFFRKCHLRFMTSDLAGVIFWGIVAFSWVVVMAESVYHWWSPAVYLAEINVTRGDALWFSYITLLTVGLGDYYFEPGFVFYQDYFIWAFVCLIGFTFLSTFLGQTSDLCKGYFPDSGEALKERLRNTQLVGIKAVHFKQRNEKVLANIGQLVDHMDDDSVHELIKRVTRIRQKKELLIHLLYQTEEELDHFTRRGEQYEDPPIARVCGEENMLAEVLEKTSRERERLDRYRDRVIPADDDVPHPGTVK